jgi:hypothetical protein
MEGLFFAFFDFLYSTKENPEGVLQGLGYT